MMSSQWHASLINDLAPQFAPHGTGRRLGGRSRVREKEPVKGPIVEIFRPIGIRPHRASSRQHHFPLNLPLTLILL